MKNSMLYYSVGALLYCPANNESIANSIINEKFGKQFSLALCLEDTINDNYVEEAENKLLDSMRRIGQCRQKQPFYIPKIFIRVRYPGQITTLYQKLNEHQEIITGFILPKFSLDNADQYINEIKQINETSTHPVYIMPILESPTIINLQERYRILYSLKEKLDSICELVLNIRVGGNDLCHMFGFRRHDTESIHSIKPISNIFSDIITVYGMDYIVSGPVWEYYNGENWKKGLITELTEDRLCGFIGKTVIHPKQIDIVNSAYRVIQKDLDDAKLILSWESDSEALVAGSSSRERMNEYKTHFNWAQKILMLAQVYGIEKDSVRQH